MTNLPRIWFDLSAGHHQDPGLVKIVDLHDEDLTKRFDVEEVGYFVSCGRPYVRITLLICELAVSCPDGHTAGPLKALVDGYDLVAGLGTLRLIQPVYEPRELSRLIVEFYARWDPELAKDEEPHGAACGHD